MIADAKAEFIRIEIKLGNTMLNIARTEQGRCDQERAIAVLQNARNALNSAKRFLPTLNDVAVETMDELLRGIEDLDRAIREYETS